MRESRWPQTQLVPCTRLGDFPDDGMRADPDVPWLAPPLNSGMTAAITRTSSTLTVAETWSDVTLIETRSPFAVAAGWRPAVNAYRCQGRFVIFADLAGVAPDSIRVSVESRKVLLRGVRPPPEPLCSAPERAQLLALEIDDGAFERALDLPQEVNPDGITTFYRDGLLRIELPLKG